jgi:tRNA threonylcarbamoyladenosine modification (KEOPS) complex  Pcc1 subunit
MKIARTDGSSIEVTRDGNSITLIIRAKDYTSDKKYIINTAVISEEEFQNIVKEVGAKK